MISKFRQQPHFYWSLMPDIKLSKEAAEYKLRQCIWPKMPGKEIRHQLHRHSFLPQKPPAQVPQRPPEREKPKAHHRLQVWKIQWGLSMLPSVQKRQTLRFCFLFRKIPERFPW